MIIMSFMQYTTTTIDGAKGLTARSYQSASWVVS